MVQLLLVGRVGKPHGVRGNVYVHAFNEDSPVWQDGTRFVVVSVDAVGESPPDVVDVGPAGTLTLAGIGRTPKARAVMAFDELQSREDVEDVRGAWLAVPVDSVDAPDDDEFFHWEVVGWDVALTDGQVVGQIVRVVETYTELLEVRPTGRGPTFFIPLVGAIVTAIDRAGRRFVIDPPEGLIP